MNASIYIVDSKNSKLGGSSKVDCTYMPISISCPNSCSLKDKGCYSQLGYVGIVVDRLEKEMKGMTTLQSAREEAKSIDNSYKGGAVPEGRFLRLRVSGDSKTIKGSKLINSAVGRWIKRSNNTGKVWSYTHAWRTIPRAVWNNVSILASISSVKEVEEARAQGYAPAIVVPDHISEKTYKLSGSDVKWIPCPQQTKEDVACTDCKLCFDSNRLYKENMGIAFAAHGARKNLLKRSLTVIQ